MAARGKTLVYMCYALLLTPQPVPHDPPPPHPPFCSHTACFLPSCVCLSLSPPPFVYYYKTDSTTPADKQTSLWPLRGGLDTVHNLPTT